MNIKYIRGKKLINFKIFIKKFYNIMLWVIVSEINWCEWKGFYILNNIYLESGFIWIRDKLFGFKFLEVSCNWKNCY